MLPDNYSIDYDLILRLRVVVISLLSQSVESMIPDNYVNSNDYVLILRLRVVIESYIASVSYRHVSVCSQSKIMFVL